MNRVEFVNLIEDVMEEDLGTFATGDELLKDFGWDSMAFMSFIAKVDSELGVTLAPAKIADCKSVNDLVELVSEHLQS